MPALDIADLRVRFKAVQALDGLTLSAEPGAVTCVLGPNGAGKTTMIRSCLGLVTPDSGQVRVLGAAPGVHSDRVGFMPQATGAWAAITGRELLTYLAKLYANPHPVDALVERLHLTEFAATPYRRCSGGQQQAINLAAAIIGRPQLVFLDEPTAGMDPHARRRTWGLIRDLRDAGVAVVLTTHAMDEASDLGDQIFITSNGRVVASGSPAELAAGSTLEETFLKVTDDR